MFSFRVLITFSLYCEKCIGRIQILFISTIKNVHEQKLSGILNKINFGKLMHIYQGKLGHMKRTRAVNNEKRKLDSY